jgi:RsmE family RNA methyltransferase
VNLILFEPDETRVPLPSTDLRAVHILEVLRRKVGDDFDVGLTNGPRGKATLGKITDGALELGFSWGDPPPPLSPVTLIIGLPRPQTARKILQESAALGVSALNFIKTERGEPSYASSTLWSSGEWRRHLLAGASQAFCTRLPEVRFGQSLNDTLNNLPLHARRIALDNYESPAPLEVALKKLTSPGNPSQEESHVVLALGAERGWTAIERTALRESHFTLAHLGTRVLRTETACVAAIAIVKSSLGWL